MVSVYRARNALYSMKKKKTKKKKVPLSEQYEYYASLDVGARQMG